MANNVVGTVSVKVTPDFRTFRTELRAQLQEIEQTQKLTIKANVNVDRNNVNSFVRFIRDDLSKAISKASSAARSFLGSFARIGLVAGGLATAVQGISNLVPIIISASQALLVIPGAAAAGAAATHAAVAAAVSGHDAAAEAAAWRIP